MYSKLLKFTESGKIGLATDIDGTISQISADPSSAIVSQECKASLLELLNTGRLAFVAIISERSALECRKLVGISGLLYLGNYGLELLEPGQQEVTLSKAVRPYQALISSVLETIHYRLLHYHSELMDYQGEPNWQQKLVFENKGATAAIHYRQTTNSRQVRQIVIQVAGEIARRAGLRLSEGRKVIEIRPPVEINKGTAVFDLVERYQLDRLIYLGDDLSDRPAFEMLHDLQRPDRLGFRPTSLSLNSPGIHSGDSRVKEFQAMAVAVSSPEMPPSLAVAADYLVDGVGGTEQFLSILLKVVQQPQTRFVQSRSETGSFSSF